MMGLSVVRWTAFVSLALLPIGADACAADSTTAAEDRGRRAHELLAKELGAKVPGYSAAVASDGELKWSECQGYADLEHRLPVRPQTQFRIGSISKALTSVGLMLLVEHAKIDLDAPIQTYIKDYPDKGAPISIRELAGHLSGIRDYKRNETLTNASFSSTRDRLKIFEDDPLVARPGTTFHYSGYNWDIIELVIERSTEMSFVSFMDEMVLRPMNLTKTCAETRHAHVDNRTKFYELGADGSFVIGPEINLEYAWAKGGYLSTAEDLAHFGSALLSPGFLKQSSLDLLFTSQRTSSGERTGYGIGWYIYSKPKVLYHSGWSVGGLSILLMLPDEKIVVAILTNRGKLNVAEGSHFDFNIEELGFKLAQCFASQARQ